MADLRPVASIKPKQSTATTNLSKQFIDQNIDTRFDDLIGQKIQSEVNEIERSLDRNLANSETNYQSQVNNLDKSSDTFRNILSDVSKVDDLTDSQISDFRLANRFQPREISKIETGDKLKTFEEYQDQRESQPLLIQQNINQDLSYNQSDLLNRLAEDRIRNEIKPVTETAEKIKEYNENLDDKNLRLQEGGKQKTQYLNRQLGTDGEAYRQLETLDAQRRQDFDLEYRNLMNQINSEILSSNQESREAYDAFRDPERVKRQTDYLRKRALVENDIRGNGELISDFVDYRSSLNNPYTPISIDQNIFNELPDNLYSQESLEEQEALNELARIAGQTTQNPIQDLSGVGTTYQQINDSINMDDILSSIESQIVENPQNLDYQNYGDIMSILKDNKYNRYEIDQLRDKGIINPQEHIKYVNYLDSLPGEDGMYQTPDVDPKTSDTQLQGWNSMIDSLADHLGLNGRDRENQNNTESQADERS